METEMKIAIACSFQAYSQRNGVSTLAVNVHDLFPEESDLIRIGKFENKNFLRWKDDPIDSILSMVEYYKTDLRKYDFTFVPSLYAQGNKTEDLRMLSLFPHPIIARVDDFIDLDEDFEWIDDVDVFICFKEKLGKWCEKKYPRKKIIISGLPYIPKILNNEQRKNNVITTMSRVDPIKRLELLLDVASRIKGVVRLSGTKFDNPEFRYWNRFILSLASQSKNVEINLEDDFKEVNKEFLRSNSYYGATFWSSGIGVEYAALEAMDCGCVPVVTDRMRRDYEREGFKACFWDLQEDLVLATNKSFDYNKEIIFNNIEVLKERPKIFKKELMTGL